MKLWSLRPPVVRWWSLVFLIWALQTLWALTRWLLGHGTVLGALLIVAGTWYVIAEQLWLILAMATGAVLLALGGWAEMNKVNSWSQLQAQLVARWRLLCYRRRWADVMVGAQLTWADDMPQLVACRLGGTTDGRDLDVLTVHTVPGQTVDDWRAQRVRLAAALDRRSVRPHAVPGRRQVVELYVSHHRKADAGISAGMPSEVPPEQEQEQEQDTPRGAFPKTPKGRP
jgi:hypothetical protein